MKKERKFLGLGLIVFIVLLLGFIPAGASATTYSLNEANLAFPGGPPYATVDLTVTGTTATFVVHVLTGLDDKIAKFGFNTDVELTAANFTTYPTNWLTTVPRQMDGFGDFDWTIGSSAEADRMHDFTIVLTNYSAIVWTEADFAISNDPLKHPTRLFAAHLCQVTGLTGFIAGGDQYGTPPVPEPTTLLLMGLGLIGLGALKRKYA